MTLLLFGLGPTVATVPGDNLPSIWDSGVEWGPAATTGADAYWQAGSGAPFPRTGTPQLAISIGGQAITEQFTSASWSLGRSDWLSTLSPNTASFTFDGIVDCAPNDSIVVSLISDVTTQNSAALWVGRVDTPSVSQDTAGNYWTTVTGIDVIGILGLAKAPKAVSSGRLNTLTTSLAATAGIALTVDTDATLPLLDAEVDTDGATVLEYVNRMERSSNALLFLLGSGHLAARQRVALTATSVDILPLSGLNGYSSWTETLSTASVVNTWRFQNQAGDLDQSSFNAASVAAYGEHAYTVSDMLRDEYAYDDILFSAVLNDPRPIVTSAEFPIYDLGQRVLFLNPLDWVDHDGDTWQTMSVSHDVSPGSWRMSATFDQTQNYLAGEGDPTPISEPFLDTQELTAVKDSFVVKFGGGTFAGSGADEWLPVGLFADDVYRSLIQFPINWPVGFIRVHKATLHLRTSQATRITTFGSAPKVNVRRVTNTWTEGGTTWPADAGNGVIWPGPGTSTAGQKTLTVTRTQNTDVDIAITEIAQGWHDDPDGNHGLRLAAVSESSSRYAIEFFSSDHSTHGPTLTLVCETSA